MSEKSDIVVKAAMSQMGSPYVFGAWGSLCTPAVRKKYAGYNPDHADNIKKKCQVLNGKASVCTGCKWDGSRCFDCRGFTYWCLQQASITISGGGASSQYNNAANWIAYGTIDQMPDLVCCVFQHKNGKMIHTGLHVGGGQIIHCSVGVQTGKTSDKGWTHYAIPAGLYTDEELKEVGVIVTLPVLKKGSKGEYVKTLQLSLNQRGYDAGTADGVFGDKTLAALKRYQADNGLTADGVCGSRTWAALTGIEPVDPVDPIKPDKLTPEQRAIIHLAEQCRAAGLNVDIPSFEEAD